LLLSVRTEGIDDSFEMFGADDSRPGAAADGDVEIVVSVRLLDDSMVGVLEAVTSGIANGSRNCADEGIRLPLIYPSSSVEGSDGVDDPTK
jgi:hypothetical protein